MVRRLNYFDASDVSIWLDPIDLFLATEISRSFPKQPGGLSVLEVGVYKGAWILSLSKNVATFERLVGIDPYPDDHQALRHELPKRVMALGLTEKFTHYDSWETMADGEASEGSPNGFNVIHVDGDHTFAGAALDLSYVNTWLLPGGVVIVDDFYNLYYPGIASATYKFLESKGFALFGLSKNKAYACRLEDQVTWFRRLATALDDSPLGYSIVDWRGLDEMTLASGTDPQVSPKMLLCLDENGRSAILPAAWDRHVRRLAKDWLPPRIGSWVQARGVRR